MDTGIDVEITMERVCVPWSNGNLQPIVIVRMVGQVTSLLVFVKFWISSLYSKRFRGVWEQRTGFLEFWPCGKWGESQK